MHSSLKSLGEPRVRAEDIINSMLDVLGADGTLLMPALSYQWVTPDNPHFDQKFTPSNVGALPEAFRKRINVLRSLHPTHSVCGFGKQAERILAKHQLDRTPVGENSPFSLLPKYGGQILMLGCGLNPNTSMHGIEELVEPDYLYNPVIEYQLVMMNGTTVSREYRPHNFDGWAQRYDRLIDQPDLKIKKGRVLSAECQLIDAESMWSVAKSCLMRDAHFFVEPVSPGHEH